MTYLRSKYYSRLNDISSWGVFILAIILYLLTLDHSASYWDCPEYITCASRLEVGHPPGNPVWTLAMRFATMLFPSHLHAIVVNACSALSMAFAAFFLARIVFIFCIFLGAKRMGEQNDRSLPFISSCCSFTAGATFALCDSAWFSAVEAEVYAMSAFLTSLSIWLMLKWTMEESESRRRRLIILVAYLTGLSLGVHQLNLLCIPVFALIYVFRKCPGNATWKAWVAIFASFAVVSIILLGMMQGVLSWTKGFELFAVNNLGLPYFTGTLTFPLLLCIAFPLASFFIANKSLPTVFLAVFFSVWLSGAFIFKNNIALGGVISAIVAALAVYVIKLSRSTLLTINWMTAFILLGYSSFAVILIRGYAAPPMNEAQPTDIFALSSYIAREQYGSKPLLYGATPYSKPMLLEEWESGASMPKYSHYYLKSKGKTYAPYLPDPRLFQRSGMITAVDSAANAKVTENQSGYLISDYAFTRVSTPELDMWFPRITGSSPYDLASYEDWTGMNKQTMTKVKISEAIDTLGKPVGRLLNDGTRSENYSWRPTYLQNLQMFVAYQVYYMYFRYLLWNFIGRQNDIHSTGEIEHGNFITGLPAIDNLMLGDQSLLPDYAGTNNPGRHVYFGLPFILGIIGIFFLSFNGKNGKRLQAIVTLMFLMTGLAIVVYLNQTPGEARERDYSFLGSYMAFCIWIGFGIMWGISSLSRLKVSRPVFISISIASTLFIPVIMLAENYGDHQRFGRSEPLDFASDILSLNRPAIIFSHGDNHTFPLWYARETEGIGQRHTVIDISYLASPGYVINLMKQGSLNFTATPADIAYNAYAFTRIASDADTLPVPLINVLKELYSERSGTPSIRHSQVLIPEAPSDTLTVNLRSLASGGSILSFKTLMLLDIIATNNQSPSPKPLLFLYSVNNDFFKSVAAIVRNGYGYHVYDSSVSDSCYNEELAENFRRSLMRLQNKDIKPYYRDPVVMNHNRRHRGCMIITSRDLLSKGDTASAMQAVDLIERHYPYAEIPAGSMTVADTTFYEGIAYGSLLKELAAKTAEDKYEKMADTHADLLKAQTKQWERYYRSLSPRRRHTVSNSTRRILASPNTD